MTQLQAFGITLTCELLSMLLLARHYPLRRVTLTTISANGLTHPLAWHIASKLSPVQYIIGLWWIEAGVVLVESLWYWWWLRVRPLTALRFSLLSNAASLGIGWLLW
ncbi:hypothetical protein [Comamonas testosteroni]|uniref:hypothetical protein n=1 Tax=Comamonas testosteroni TaxID=285 RepID=UPI002E11A167|nr:hypothetical protein U0024_14980 [Comamonas testosteroni]